MNLSSVSREMLRFSFMGESFYMDHPIVHVPQEDASLHFWSEFCIDHGLEHGGRVCHPEEHDKWLK
jgi:hypothetical protein